MLMFLHQICRISVFKAGPQHLPPRLDFLLVSILAVFLSDVIGAMVSEKPAMASALAMAFVSIVAEAGLLYALLAAFKKQNRFTQVATSWYGVQAIFGAMILVLGLLVGIDLADLAKAENPAILVFVMPLLWFVAVAVYIIKQSLDCSLPGAILALLGLGLLQLLLLEFIFGVGDLAPASINALPAS